MIYKINGMDSGGERGACPPPLIRVWEYASPDTWLFRLVLGNLRKSQL